MGVLSNIIASYLVGEYLVGDMLNEIIFGVRLGTWLIVTLLLITAIVIYNLVLTPEVTQVRIYTNIMVNEVKNCIHLSPYAPWAIQWAELIWSALDKDGSPLAKQIIQRLHGSDSDALSLDLIEYLIFQVLSGFDIFWASGKMKSYGYPTWPRRLGEITEYRPSTIYKFKKKHKEEKHDDFETKDLHSVFEKNPIAKHFLGDTSLSTYQTPLNWLVFTPKGTEISIQRNTHIRTIRLSNWYCTINLAIRKESVGTGLPYGIRIKEKNYNEKEYFTTDFRIDVSTSFSRWLSIHPRIDDYHNWKRLIFEKLVANFCLSRRGVIEEAA